MAPGFIPEAAEGKMSGNSSEAVRSTGPGESWSDDRGRRLRRATGALVAILTVSGPIALGGPAGASSPFTPGTVTVAPATAGAPSDYTVPFTTSSSGALAAGATITFTAPNDTAFPSTSGPYSVVVNNGHAATVSGVTVSDVTGPSATSASTTPNQVVITLGTSSIAAGDLVSVSISGASNPTLASTTYVINESTSSDVAPTASPSYSIVPGTAASIVASGGDNQSASGAFPVHLTATVVDVYGNPVSQVVTVTFAAPSSGASGTFASSGCSSNPQTYECVTSTSNGVATASVFTANATSGGPYAVTASITSPVSGSATFYETNLATPGTSVTPGSVTPSSTTEGASSVTYGLSFVPSGSGALQSCNTVTCTITLVGPNGTVFPATTGNYTVTDTTTTLGQTVASVTPSAAVGPGAPTTNPACTNQQGTLSGSTCTSTTHNKVVLSFTSVATLMRAGDTIDISVTGMTNPTFATSTDVLDESTSADTLPITSPTYSITTGPVASIQITSGNNQSTEVGMPFASPLVATAEDAAGNPVSGAQITFTIGTSSGASASFPSHSNIQIATTGANGQATTSVPTANGTAGSYSVTVTDGAVSATPMTLTNTTPPGTPGTVVLSSGTEGASSVTYTIPFTATANGAIPPSGTCPTSCTITLVAPNGTSFPGPTGDYGVAVNNGHAATVTGDTLSMVTGPGANTPSTTDNQVVISLNPSTIGDGDTITVTITGVTNPTLASTSDVIDEATSADTTLAPSPAYTITNGAAAQLVVTGGNNQSAAVGAAFGNPLVVTVEDAAGNAVPGAGLSVTFAAPSSGASGTFASSGCTSNPQPYECVASTDAGGVATSSVFTANSTVGGPYVVSASITSPSASVNFNLSNLPVLTPGTITVVPDSVTSTAAYTIPFIISATGGLPAAPSGGPGCPTACTITFVAPNGTTFPATPGDYTVAANNNHGATVLGVALSKVTSPGSSSQSSTYNRVVITLDASSIADGDLVTVTVAGVTNPSGVSASNVMDESTASDTTPAASPPYSIVAGPAAKVVVLAGNNQSTGTNTAFASPLSVTVEDAEGNAEGAGISVTFAAPSSGASGTFASSGCTSNPQPYECVVSTNSSGVATSSVFTANGTGGQYSVMATSGALTSATFTLTNLSAVTPAAVTVAPATAGTSGVTYTVPFTTSSSGAIPPSGSCPSSCTITLVAPNDTTFSSTASDYAVAVNNSHSATVSGVTVSMVTGPGSNSASSTNNQVVITLSASTIAAGDQVTVTAGGATNPTTAAGTYTLDESTSGDPLTATSPAYAITSGPAATITIVAGNNQSATAGTAFATPLQVQLLDAYGNPVSGAVVLFAAPSSGQSGTFDSSGCTTNPEPYECEVNTGANGVATASTFTANQTAGSYFLGTGAIGVNQVNFTLTNTAAPTTLPPPPPPSQGNGGPVVLQQNGAPSLFVVGAGGSLLNYWYIPQTGSWGAATVAPSGITSTPSVQLQTNGAPTVFVQGAGGALWNYWYIPQTGSWGAAEIVSSGVTSAPWAQLQQNGAPTVFVQGAGGSLINYWYIPQTGSWGSATVAPSGVTSAPSVQLQQNGAPTVFVQGAGGSLWNYWYIPQTGSWGAAEIASSGVTSAPSVQLQQNGAPTVFVQGGGGSLWNYWYIPQTGSWGAAEIVASGVTSAPSVQLQTNGAPTVFVQGGGGSLLNYWYIPQSGSWGAATVASSGVSSQPALQLQTNGAPTLFVVSGASLLNYWYIPQSGSWGAATVAQSGVVAP